MAVLDASAVIAVIRNEPGAEAVVGAVPDGAISTVNVCEVLTKLSEAEVPENAAREALALLSLEIVDFDQQNAIEAARLRLPTRHRGLSMGDRACLALAKIRGERAVTTDRAWAELDVGVEVEVIR